MPYYRSMKTTLAYVERTIVTNAQGYKEVSLEFRQARAMALETSKVHLRENRLHCPVLDASRTDAAYGIKALPGSDRAALKRWAKGLGVPAITSGIAYSSGPWYKIPSNIVRKRFQEEEMNYGLISVLKRGVNTGILKNGRFDPDAFNQFVWNLHHDFKDIPINNAFLHSHMADNLYVGSDKLQEILKYNQAQSTSRFFKRIGTQLSKLEMKRLLLEELGQAITPDPERKPTETIQAISVRDLHDLYCYGVFPAIKEDQLLKAGLIEESSLALTAMVQNQL